MVRRVWLILILVLALPTSSFTAEYWAFPNSSKYPYPSCQAAQKVRTDNLIKFFSNRAAKKAGYCLVGYASLSNRGT